MKVTAKLNYLRISPRKVRLVADLIRRKKVEQAQSVLKFTTKKAVKPIIKLLNSAVANAKNDFQLEESNLYISKITVDEGPKMKRWKPRSRGRTDQILKRSSHITIVLEEIKETKKPRKATSRPRGEKETVKPAKIVKKELKPEAKEMEKADESAPAKATADKEEKEEVKLPEQVKETPEEIKQRVRLREQRKKPKVPRGLKRIFRRKAF